MERILDQSLLEVANLYRRKELSPVEVVKDTFTRIEISEERLNAFITLLKDDAILKAKQAEKMFQKGESTSILTGIPYSAKDLFYTKDILTTCASNVFKDFKPLYTAKLIESLSNSGAILVGKNNMLEFAYGIVHEAFGQTNNPWDLGKTSGGSSSGSCAAVGAGIGYFSLGTDTGGSIRIPASYCGVVGMKPTYGLVDTHGVFPLSWSLDHAGPITRTVKEAIVVLSAMIGKEDQIAHQLDCSLLENTKLKVGILPSEKLAGLTSEVLGVYEATLKAVNNLGWELVPIDVDNLDQTEGIIMDILLPEAANIHQKYFHQKNDYAPLTYHQLELGMKHNAVTYLNGLQSQREYKATVASLFDEVDILLTPTVSFPAPSEDPAIGDEDLDEMVFTGPFNISGNPAVSLNMGYTKQDGLPVGMQLVGNHFEDFQLLKAAYCLEQQVERKNFPILKKEEI